MAVLRMRSKEWSKNCPKRRTIAKILRLIGNRARGAQILC